MNADELRRLAENTPKRRRQEEEKRRQESIRLWLEQEYTKARQAVAELDNNVRQAANAGMFEATVYKAEEFVSGAPAPVTRKRIIKKRGRLEDWVVDIVCIPDYAQHVFASCPSNLNHDG